MSAPIFDELTVLAQAAHKNGEAHMQAEVVKLLQGIAKPTRQLQDAIAKVQALQPQAVRK